MRHRLPWPARTLLPLMLAATLSACASRPVLLPPTPRPAPPAAAMTDDLPSSLDYSQRARDWLKRAGDELKSLLSRKPPCSVTQPADRDCT